MGWHNTSRQSRDYGAEWDKLRLEVLRRDNGLCQCSHCKAAGLITIASEVDHIVSRARAKQLGWSKARTEDPANLQAINTECHKRKTIEENGGEFRSKPTIGLDGFPIA